VGISASLTLISLSEDLFDSRPAFIGSLYLSVMTTARLIHSSMTSYVSSSNADLPANVVEGPPLSDEASPLLKPKHTHADRLSTFNSWSSALSSFFDVNTGLLLVAASQVFFSAMNLSVKVLNSLDEPVPTFEVRSTPKGPTSS
jgi:hypothetical protein